MTTNMDATLAENLPALGAYFRRRGDVLLAYLYGSYARGTAGPLSDVDVAVLLEGAPDARERFQARLEQLIDYLPEEDRERVRRGGSVPPPRR